MLRSKAWPRWRVTLLGVPLAAAVLLVPNPVDAQGETGTIAGVVKDATGLVLPGVTVEASSSSLIERVRTVVTDTDGQYKIISLHTGTYAVTFSLPGFSTVKREGIELPAAFTATVNAELKVGNVEETITVEGGAPVVDVQSVLQQKTVSRDIMDALPTAKTFAAYAVLIPGVTVSAPDVGGAYGDLSVSLAVHGSRNGDSQIVMDGMPVRNGLGGGGNLYGQFLNNGMMQEISVETGALSAENESAGVRSNVIPRDGSNTFRGVVFGNYANSSMNSANVSDALKAQGLNTNSVDRLYDFNPSYGGRLVRDKLWFFLSYRDWGTRTTRAGAGAAHPNLTPGGLFYTPDLDHKAFDHTYHLSASDRMTWQASSKNKVALLYEWQYHDYEFPTNAVGNAPETRAYFVEKPQYLAQATWSSPVTSRLLLEAGWTAAVNDFPEYPEADVVPGVPPITELSTNFTYRASATAPYGHNRSNNLNYRASASYVTGSHSAKVGLFLSNTWMYQTTVPNSPLNYSFRNGIPVSLVEWATPISYHENTKYNIGLYAQDKWTAKRMTLNLGVRSDLLNMYALPQSLPAGAFVPARNFPGVYHMPNWKDVSPRVGVAYDVFGNGRTAVKASVGRYVLAMGVTNFTKLVDPMAASVNSVTRTWTDTNGDYIPDCDLTNPLANGECGQMQNLNFGKSVPVTRYASDVSQGFGVRPYNWEGSFGVQHEILNGLSATATYNRRWYGNLLATDNLSVTSDDFSPFCVTVPSDSRLPGSGSPLCGFYDVSPAKLGQTNNVIAHASDFGGMTDIYDGLDFSVTSRWNGGLAISGGANFGRERTNNCNLATNLAITYAGSATGVLAPHTTPYCDVRPPMLANIKFFAVYPLPLWALQASGSIQSSPGPAITASYSATNAQIAPSLGRNLSSGANGTVLVDLIAPGTQYSDRVNQVDFRLAKIVRIGGVKIQGMVDLYNLLNASPSLQLQTRYGSAWLSPTQTLIGRLIKVGGQIDF